MPNVPSKTIAAIIDVRTFLLFVAAIRSLIEQGECINADLLSGATSEMGQKQPQRFVTGGGSYSPVTGCLGRWPSSPLWAINGLMHRSKTMSSCCLRIPSFPLDLNGGTVGLGSAGKDHEVATRGLLLATY
jgi:hypothetical protein